MSNASEVISPPLFVTNSGTSVPNYTPPAKVLVLGCIDPRFASFLQWFLVHQKNVYGQYDLFTLAGASLGVNQAEEGVNSASAGPEYSGQTWSTAPATGNYMNAGLLHWDDVFYQHLGLAVSLHSITDVWIFDHLDCGAYKIIKFNNPSGTDTDVRAHSDEIARLALNLKIRNLGEFSSLKVKGFVMNTNGDIFKVYDDNTGGLNLNAPGAEGGLWWILPTVLFLLVFVFLYFKYIRVSQ
jgi:hypothetical protein